MCYKGVSPYKLLGFQIICDIQGIGAGVRVLPNDTWRWSAKVSRLARHFLDFLKQNLHKSLEKAMFCKIKRSFDTGGLGGLKSAKKCHVLFEWPPISYTYRLLLNPIILDCQSNPNPSQICDIQSKSKSDFQNGLTIQIQSQSNYFWKNILDTNIKWQSFMIKPLNSQETPLYQLKTLQINKLFEK